MEKKYQVFVSSTYEDLKEERAKVIGTLLENDCIPVGMEQFPSSNLSQWDYIKSMIDMSDYYIVIVAGRYGSIDPKTNISYTELEYDYANQCGIPILTFLHEKPDKIESGKCERNDEGRDKLEQFRNKLKSSGKLVKYYSDIGDLSGMVATSINNAFQNTPRTGWIRADYVQQIVYNSDSVKEIQEIQNQLINIQKIITEKLDAVTPTWEPITKEDIDIIFKETIDQATATDEEVNEMINEVLPPK